MSTLIEHLEAHLGEIAEGWSLDEHGHKLPLQVVRFSRSPIRGVLVLSTLGLSNAALAVKNTPRRLKQELVMMFREVDGVRNLPGILQEVAMHAISSDHAYSIGDVIGPRGRLQEDSPMEALYVALPMYLADSFQVCRCPGGPVVFGWLVPITASEAHFVQREGREAFESELARYDPDLVDFRRPSIV